LRAEKASSATLTETFVDSAPLLQLLSNNNSSITYGRRGTGKAHALRFLESQVKKRGEEAIYIDLRTIGSNTSIYNDNLRSTSERATQLINDVLEAILSSLYPIAISKLDQSLHPEQISLRLDDLQKAIGSVKILGQTENTNEKTLGTQDKIKAGISGSLSAKPTINAETSTSADVSTSLTSKIKNSGNEVIHLDFGNIQTTLVGLLAVLNVPKYWLLIDEWSEIPFDLQPYLADLIRRTILPIENCVLKIAAIEHRSNFRFSELDGSYVGFELGADITANINLDDFLVFDAGGDKSIQFFKNLLFKHYTSSEQVDLTIDTADKLIQVSFTQISVFSEFVRAVEGVPRDALNLAAVIATSGYGRKISMQDVKSAARTWYQRDKFVAIRQNEPLSKTLSVIIEEVLKNRRSRAFLFDATIRNTYLESLFDSRLLHILKKNVSSHDEPGARYDVFKIDYGCYVDLISTSNAPLGLFEAQTETQLNLEIETTVEYVDVPRDDYRSIRRAILRPEQLELTSQ
jgi:hypothetical protein